VEFKQLDFKNLDNKSKIQLAVTSILILVFLVITGNSVKVIIRKLKPGVQETSKTITKDESQSIDMSNIKTRVSTDDTSGKWIKDADKNVEWGRDPFHKMSDSISVLQLQGITWHEKSPKAIISNMVVGIGDRVGPNKIVDIKKDRVILNDGTNNFELTLD